MFLKIKNGVSMIPYPSGKIHIGHIRNYIISDIYNRLSLINEIKLNNMHMAWDSFGTPAENASTLNNKYPLKFLKQNILFMKKQLENNIFSINWKKSFSTFEHNYYYFNQKLILKLLKKKLLFLSNKKINWDACDNSVLSNEQVINGRGWRSNCLVKKKNILTYYFKIKEYRLEILKELENLNWPERVKLMQKNWIFNKVFYFCLLFFIYKTNYKKKVFLSKLIFFFYISKKNNKKIIDFFFLTIIYKIFFFKKNINNIFFFKDIFKKKYEKWLYFKKNNFYNYKHKFNVILKLKKKYIFLKCFLINLSFEEICILFKKKYYINSDIKWKIKDWGFSRQRYWGTPLPTFFCNNCKKYYTSKYLPVLISKNLKKNIFFLKKKKNMIKCEICLKNSFKDPQTMDTFIDSSWYFLKYYKNRNILNLFMPIDLYVGGSEHSILHLLYSRYIIKILRDLKYLNFGEPFKRLYIQGMILYKIICKNDVVRISKMSKSKNNIIKPEDLIFKYNIESLRFTILKNSLKKDFYWKNSFVKWSYLFLIKFWKCFFLKKNINFKKNIFFKNFKINKNIKYFFNYININFKKILFFFKNLKYNSFIIFIIKIFKNLKKVKFLIKNNFLILKKVLFNILKFLKCFLPWPTIKILFILNYYKSGLKKIYFSKIFKIFIKKIKKLKKILILKNKNIGFILYSKLLKKKIINFLFFKKKIKKTYIKKITLINLIINLLYL